MWQCDMQDSNTCTNAYRNMDAVHILRSRPPEWNPLICSLVCKCTAAKQSGGILQLVIGLKT